MTVIESEKSMEESTPIRILCMEDDRDLAKLLKSRLERAGYIVDFANDGKAGLEMYQRNQYDVLAIDQHMPHYDGLDVLRQLARQGPLPPTVMVTGTGSEIIAVEALKLGASDYLVKDVDGGFLDLLPTVIEQVLLKQRILKEKQQALEALERRNENLALLNEAGQAFTTTLDLKELARSLLQMATRLVGARGSSIWLWDDAQPGWLVCQVVYNEGEHYSPLNLRLRPGEGVAGWVAQFEQGTIVTHVDTDPRFSLQIDQQTGFRTTCLIGVPLHGRDGLLGVLEIVNKIEGTFDQNDLTLIEALAAPAAIAIDNARMVMALRQRAQELQERNEELDAFAHMVAHDLKGPLATLIGYADVMSDYLDSITPEEMRENLDAILRSGKKMTNIIEELLLLAGVRQMDVSPEPLLMRAIINDAVNRLEIAVDETGADITINPNMPTAMGYAPWLEEVWVNYLDNAMKYGGSPPKLTIGADDPENGRVCFWVQDNGAGLTDAQQGKLFIPFTRLSQIRAEGHGLGLSIVHRIISKLHGEVGVESVMGQGSRFWFTLPQA